MNLSYVLVLVGDRGREVIDDLYGDAGRDGGGGAGQGAGRCDRVGARSCIAGRRRSSSPSTSGASSGLRPRRRRGSTSPWASATRSRTAPSSPAASAGASTRRGCGGRSCSGTSGRWSRTRSSPSGCSWTLRSRRCRRRSTTRRRPCSRSTRSRTSFAGSAQRTLDLGRLVGVRGFTRVTYPAPTWDDLVRAGRRRDPDVRLRLAPGRAPAAAPAREPRRDGHARPPGRRARPPRRLDAAIEAGSRSLIARTRT